MTLAVRTGIAPSVWADEPQMSVMTAVDVLRRMDDAARTRPERR